MNKKIAGKSIAREIKRKTRKQISAEKKTCIGLEWQRGIKSLIDDGHVALRRLPLLWRINRTKYLNRIL